MEQNIVIAVDHSAQAENAVKFYLERVHRPGNKVVLVNCIELPEMVKARDSYMSPSVLANMWKEEEAKTKILEDRLRKLLSEKEVPGTLRTSSGKPGEVICQIADEVSAAMIITGTRGLGKVRRTILGSVSDYLVNRATCPVMICRDPSDVDRKRHPSVEGVRNKLRHGSGDSVGSFTASLRQRFASGGKGRSQSVTSEREDTKEKKKENREPKNAATAEEEEEAASESTDKTDA